MKRLMILLVLLVGCATPIVEYEAQVWNETGEEIYVMIRSVETEETVFDDRMVIDGVDELHITPGCYRCVSVYISDNMFSFGLICYTQEEIDEGLKKEEIPIFVIRPERGRDHVKTNTTA